MGNKPSPEAAPAAAPKTPIQFGRPVNKAAERGAGVTPTHTQIASQPASPPKVLRTPYSGHTRFTGRPIQRAPNGSVAHAPVGGAANTSTYSNLKNQGLRARILTHPSNLPDADGSASEANGSASGADGSASGANGSASGADGSALEADGSASDADTVKYEPSESDDDEEYHDRRHNTFFAPALRL